MSDILTFYSIPVDKVEKATTDNGSNFLKAFRVFSEIEEELDADLEDNDDDSFSEIEEEYEFQTIEYVSTSSSADVSDIKLPPLHACTSHTLNLICTSKEVCQRNNRLQRSTFAKCVGFWNAIGRSVKKNEAVVNECGHAVVTPAPTRWNSLYDAISFLLRFENKLASMFRFAGKCSEALRTAK